MAVTDIEGICAELSPLADMVVLTASSHPRAIEPGIATRFIQADFSTPNVISAIELAKELVQTDDLILITGSVFVVGEARNYLKGGRGED